MSDLRSLTEILSPMLPYLLITFFTWFTYHYSLRTGAVSDDLAGIMDYNGSLMYPKIDSDGKEVKDKDGKQVLYLRIEYGTVWRWLRYHICGGNTPSKHKFKTPDGKEVIIPNGKVASHHHFLSIALFNITCIVTYIALIPFLGSKIALMSVVFLIVHPCTTQGVAWFSGLAYPLSLLWMSLIIILTHWFYLNPSVNSAVWFIPVFCLLQWLAIHAIFATTAMLWIILLFLGYWQVSILGLLISIAMCFDEIRKIVTFRVVEFKKQNLQRGTVFGWRKIVVAFKTLFYYIRHTLVPTKLGLYHKWNFHYDDSTERMDNLFLAGLVSFCLLTCIFIKVDCISIKLGILWFVVFMLGFANFITAQQFVTERYIMISNLGFGMIVATLTQNYFWIYTAIVAGYLVRTWTHLPTYDNELRFYLSNIWNFPDSEVAYGNLGVTYMRGGMMGSGMDAWMAGAMLNPEYDVPYYNIFSTYKGQAMISLQNGDYQGAIVQLNQAYPWLEKTLACKTCHFPELWKKEQAELLEMIKSPANTFRSELMRLLKLDMDLKIRISKASSDKEKNDINISINNNNIQINRLMDYMKSNKILVNPPIGTEADLLRRLTQPTHYIRRY